MLNCRNRLAALAMFGMPCAIAQPNTPRSLSRVMARSETACSCKSWSRRSSGLPSFNLDAWRSNSSCSARNCCVISTSPNRSVSRMSGSTALRNDAVTCSTSWFTNLAMRSVGIANWRALSEPRTACFSVGAPICGPPEAMS